MELLPLGNENHNLVEDGSRMLLPPMQIVDGTILLVIYVVQSLVVHVVPMERMVLSLETSGVKNRLKWMQVRNEFVRTQNKGVVIE